MRICRLGPGLPQTPRVPPPRVVYLPHARERLQNFFYYVCTFYTELLEEPTLNPFKSGWLEALGDLVRYKMAFAAMANGATDPGTAPEQLNVLSC